MDGSANVFSQVARERRIKTYLFEWIGSFSLRRESLDFFRSHRLVPVADLISSLSAVGQCLLLFSSHWSWASQW